MTIATRVVPKRSESTFTRDASRSRSDAGPGLAVPIVMRGRSRWARPDPTRPLPLEELAELQLEQGYADRALRIYENLAARSDHPETYTNRLETLRRMVTVRALKLVRVG
jgi:hypothetical protein